MASNLLDLVKGQLSDTIMGKAAAFLDEEAGATQKAMQLILPSVLGSLTNQATSPDGAAALHKLFTDGKHDETVFNGLGTLLAGGSATQGLLNSGQTIVSALFGSNVSRIADWLSAFAGIKNGSASSLLNIAAPLLMSAISKQLGGNTTASALTNLLGSQLPFLQKAGLPTGLMSLLGLNNLNLTPPSVMAKENDLSNRGFDRVLPWLLMGAVAIGALFLWKTCNKVPEIAEPITVDKTMETVPMVVGDSIAVRKLTLPNGEVVVKAGSFLDQLYTEITDKTLDPTKAMAFDNINFATASAEITEGSKTQLDDLVKIMQGFPNVDIRITGHTDNAGKAAANKYLSEARANAVKMYLVKQRIDSKRIGTAGFGSEKPVADNTTEAGRAKNRRIEAFVVRK